MKTEADFCKEQQAAVKDELAEQAAVVRKLGDRLEEARRADAAAKKGPKRNRSAAGQEEEGASSPSSLEEGEGGVMGAVAALSTSRAATVASTDAAYDRVRRVPRKAPKRKRSLTEKRVFNLEHEVAAAEAVLANYEEQQETLHVRCVNGPLAAHAAGMRKEARADHLEALKGAYEIMDARAGGR